MWMFDKSESSQIPLRDLVIDLRESQGYPNGALLS
jgi:hypothetical protein